MRYALIVILTGLLFGACTAPHDKASTTVNYPMRTEFLQHCQARPEYASRKRAGTLDKYCLCVFDKTMEGLTEKERIAAGFYLFGEASEDYIDRYPIDIMDAMDAMMPASEAISKAVKSCS